MLSKRPVGFVSFCHSAAVFSSPAVYKHDFKHCSSSLHECRYARCSYVAVTVTVKGAFHDKNPAAECTSAAARHTHMLGQRVLLHTNTHRHETSIYLCTTLFPVKLIFLCSAFPGSHYKHGAAAQTPRLSLSLFLSGSCERVPMRALALSLYLSCKIGERRESEKHRPLSIKSNQITFFVTSPQHKCLGE